MECLATQGVCVCLLRRGRFGTVIVLATAVTPSERRATRSTGNTASHTAVSTVTGVLLVLDPPVLEPDLDLFLAETQRGGYLYPTQPRQIHAGCKLVLETK